METSVILPRNSVCLSLLCAYSIHNAFRGQVPATHGKMTVFWFDVIGRIILSHCNVIAVRPSKFSLYAMTHIFYSQTGS